MTMISERAVIHEGVELGTGCIVEDFVIIGAPIKGMEEQPKTIIGDNAVIRSHTVIYAGNRIGDGFQTGNKANIRELNEIGDNVSIGTLSVVEHHVKIGDGARIHSQVFIPEYTVLKERAWLGPNVVLTNARYPQTRYTKDELKGPVIEEGAKVGANSTLLPGIVIGKNSLIGAGSVVTKDAVPMGTYFGSPSRRIGWVCTCGLRLEGKNDRRFVCTDCDKEFVQDNGELRSV